MSRTAPFGTDEQPRYDTKIVGGKTLLRPIEKESVCAKGGGDAPVKNNVDMAVLPTPPDGCRSRAITGSNNPDIRLRPAPAGKGRLYDMMSTSKPAIPDIEAYTTRRNGERECLQRELSLPQIHPKLPPIASMGSQAHVDLHNVATNNQIIEPQSAAGNGGMKQPTAVQDCSLSSQGAGTARESVAEQCSNALAVSVNSQQLDDLLRELQVISLTQSGLLTEERIVQLAKDICPSLGSYIIPRFIAQHKGCRQQQQPGDAALIDCATLIPLIEEMLPSPPSVHDARMAKLLASDTAQPAAPNPRLSALKRQLSSSEPSLINVGQRPAAHSLAARLPVPQIRKEMASNDPLDISATIHASRREVLEQEQKDSAERLRQRHDAKLLLAVERDWMESIKSAHSPDECRLDFPVLAASLGSLDPDRTGKILFSQVLQACRQHKVPISAQTLHHLCRRCDHSNDGYIRWVEMLDFLERAQPVQLNADVSKRSHGDCDASVPVFVAVTEEKPCHLSIGDLPDDHMNIESPGHYSHLHLSRTERLKSDSFSNLKSSSSTSLCDKERVVQGLRRLQVALQMSSDSDRKGGQTDMSTVQRLATMHNTVYQFSLSVESLQRIVEESTGAVEQNALQRSNSAGSRGSSHLMPDAKKNLSCSSVTSMGRPRSSRPVSIHVFVQKLCSELGVGEDELEQSQAVVANDSFA